MLRCFLSFPREREREGGTSINLGLDAKVTIVTETIANDLVNEDAWRIRVTRRTSERDIITARA